MNKIQYILFIGLFYSVFTPSGYGQEIEINTDRPDQSDGVYILPKNRLQLENGITFAKGTCVNNLMLRYGITGSTEIRLLLDGGKAPEGSGLLPVGLSAKQKLWDQEHIRPAVTLVGYVTFEQLASNPFRSKEVAVELKLAFENELSDRLSLGYNLGASDNFRACNLSVCAGYTLGKQTSVFIEYFATLNRNEHNFDTGIMFTPHPKWHFDIACGHALFSPDNRFFATVGAAYLF